MTSRRTLRCDVCGLEEAQGGHVGKPAGWGSVLRFVLSTDLKEALKGEAVLQVVVDVGPKCMDRIEAEISRLREAR